MLVAWFPVVRPVLLGRKVLRPDLGGPWLCPAGGSRVGVPPHPVPGQLGKFPVPSPSSSEAWYSDVSPRSVSLHVPSAE